MPNPGSNQLPTPAVEQESPRILTSRSKWWGLMTVFSIGVVISVMVFRSMGAREDRLIEAQFKLDAELRVGGIQREFLAHVGIIEAIQAFCDGAEGITPG